MRAPEYAELRSMSDDDLIRLHDKSASLTEVGLQWLMDELQRREVSRQTQTIVRLTWVIAGLTLLNLVFVALSLSD